MTIVGKTTPMDIVKKDGNKSEQRGPTRVLLASRMLLHILLFMHPLLAYFRSTTTNTLVNITPGENSNQPPTTTNNPTLISVINSH